MIKMITLLLLLSLVSLVSCSKKEKPSEKGSIDTLVSDHFLDDGEYTPDEEVYVEETYTPPKPARKNSNSSSNGTSSRNTNRGGGIDSDATVLKYQNYKRVGSNPDDFATAMIYPAIRMVYSDNFLSPKARVLQSNRQDGKYIIDMAITWRDNWVAKYEIKGQLTVGEDGSSPSFVIKEKNLAAEALEITEQNFKSTVSLTAI